MDLIFVQIAAATIGGLIAISSALLFVRLQWPAPVLWSLKLYVSALSKVLALMGAIILFAGIVSNMIFVSLIGCYNMVIFSIYVFRVTRQPAHPTGFNKAFGARWEDRIASELKRHFLPGRIVFSLPAVPDPQLTQDISFVILPGSGRELLCDIWQPPDSVTRSGLAFIYLHGGAFYLLDKDYRTRPFFRHLAAQGHVIMDVAYRLSPEADVMGMVHDVKRAIAWMKENAGAYKVDPHRIVLGGGSSGGHLALLTAYTANNPNFIPEDLKASDTSVSAVVSLYGSSDMQTLYYHTNQHLTTRSAPGRPKNPVPTRMPSWMVKRLGTNYHRLGFDKGFENAGAIAPLLGGHPDECPDTYRLYSVLTHVHAGCPPTYLIHGAHDIMAPVYSTEVLFRRLSAENVPVVMHILPQTDHAFDLVLPRLSPAAHTELYDVERFLALLSRHEEAQGATLEKRPYETIHSHSVG